MNKEEHIKKRGEESYNKMLKRHTEWNKANPEKVKRYPEEQHRKGGKYYERALKYNKTGIPGEKNAIRKKHANQYRPYKNIIAPDSQIHHEWVPGTAEYRGMALVEKDQHMHGYIDVIEILEGEITLLTEKEIKGEGK